MSSRNLRRYVLLLGAQSLCAAVVLPDIHAGFRILIENIGQPNEASWKPLTRLLGAAVLGQLLYWYRVRNVPIPAGYGNIALGHLFAFAARLGFIFGGALFSLYFLRHAPLLEVGLAGLVWRSAMLIFVLFALYCYTLELERLGGALQLPPRR